MEPELRWRLDVIIAVLLFIAISVAAVLVIQGGLLVLVGMFVFALFLAVGMYAFGLSPDRRGVP